MSADNLELSDGEAEAEGVYRRLLDIYPGDYMLSIRLLRLLKRDGRNAQALTLARQLENEYPERRQVYFELSEIYRALGREALRLMAEAEFQRLGGNRKLAIKLYEQVLAAADADLASESRAREKLSQLREKE